jgi:hypothetical protein
MTFPDQRATTPPPGKLRELRIRIGAPAPDGPGSRQPHGKTRTRHIEEGKAALNRAAAP